jgi:hypothetical protein
MKKTTAERDLAEWDREIEADFQRAVASSRTRKRKEAEPFAIVPLWHAALAAEATRSPVLLVYVDLMHRAWKAKGQPFTMPNGWLEKRGVSRKTKCRVLRNLNAAGLIVVEWRDRKSPGVTLVAR